MNQTEFWQLPNYLTQEIIDNINVGIAIFDGKDFYAKWANQIYLSFVGEPYKTTGIKGLKPDQFMPLKVAKGLMEVFNKVSNTKEPHIENEYVYEDAEQGSTYWKWSLAPLQLKDNENHDLMIVVSEITEHVLARNELKNMYQQIEKEHKKLKAILDAIPVGVFIADNNENIIETNRQVDEIWGGNALLTKTIDDYKDYKGWWADSGKTIKPEDWALARALKKGEISKGEVIDILRFDGSLGTILNSAAPMKNEQGDITGAVVTIEDITDQRLIYSLFNLTLEDLPLEKFLDKALNIILAISFFTKKGCIFLADAENQLLYMQAERGLDKTILNNCNCISFGRCLCGQAALSKRMQFIDYTDKTHKENVRIESHGHYFVPILAESKLLGLLNLYVKEGHQTNQIVLEVLTAISNVLAAAIMRIRDKEELKKHKNHLAELVDERTKELIIINEELKKEIQERKEVEERFFKVFHASPDLMSIIELETLKIVDVNGSWLRTIGHSRRNVIGSQLMEVRTFLSSEDKDKLMEILLEKGKIHNYPVTLEYIIGEKGKGLFSSNIITIKGKQYILTIVNDITELKKAEEKAWANESRFRAIVESSDDGIISSDLNGNITSWNIGAEKIFGFTADEIMGKHITRIIPEKNRSEANKLLRKAKQGQQFRLFEEEGLHKNGQLIPVSLSISPIKSISGDIIGTSAIVRDISEKKKLETEVARLERLNLVGEMAAGISHEIRNPMTTVRGFLQILSKKPECIQYESYFNLMIDELDRANAIITEFLAIGKSKPIQLKKQQLNNIVIALKPLIQADALSSDKYVEIELNDNNDILIDDKEIRQVILNLARNGLEAMQPGGRLTIKTYQQGQEIVLEVKDEGTGIDPEFIEKLGTPFFTTKENGTGLGLAICYSIVQRHNGIVDIKSNEKGTTFFVKFKTDLKE